MLISLALAFNFFTGCYTTFRHPAVYAEIEDSSGYYHSQEEIAQLDDCSSCHQEQSPFFETNANIYDEPLYNNNDDWNYYFITPWWFDESYYYEERIKTSAEPLQPPPRRTSDRRETDPLPHIGVQRDDRPALTKPNTDNDSTALPAPQPHQRNERRQTVTQDNVKSTTPATPSPQREKREEAKKETKKAK